MENPWVLFIAAFIPLVMGFIWYHPKFFGTAWMEGTGVAKDVLEKGPKPVVFVASYVMSLMLGFVLYTMSVHQGALDSLFFYEPEALTEGSVAFQQLAALKAQFAGKGRHFGHGALHGAIAGLLFALPVLATNGLFEFKGVKHIAINVGYWVVTTTLMGGVICQFV